MMRRLLALCLLLPLAGCETIFPGFSLIAPDPPPPLPVLIDAAPYLEQKGPVDPWIVPLLTDRADLTVQLVKVEDRVEPHLHEESDETIYIVAGEGDLLIERDWRRIQAGMVIHVPRNVPHAFVNRAAGGTVAISVLTPKAVAGDRVAVPYDNERAR
jgi:quercetin dioxygenase-like cupin family protein